MYLLPLFSLCCSLLSAQEISPFIHIDQFGYLPQASKVAVLSDPQTGFNAGTSYTPANQLSIRNAVTGGIVFSVNPIQWKGGAIHEGSGDRGWWADFSALEVPGEYYIYDSENDQRSATFTIGDEVYGPVLKAAGRMFYYNRCNLEKATPYAEPNWTDTNAFQQDANARYVYDQDNAALEKDLTGGWFDAGDYNKYVTFAHSAIHNLLWAYRENPQAFGDNWNIPESGNGIPDLIDEIKWELDWLLKMNNADGSTHIKIGAISYDVNGFSPPSSSSNQATRYYGPTCSAASIAVASMFAHAALVFQQFPSLANYAELLENRAIAAWDYVQPNLNTNSFDEACDDGTILSGDADWNAAQQIEGAVIAAVHLMELTNDLSYQDYLVAHYAETEPLANSFWGPYKFALNDALLLYTTLPGTNVIVDTSIKNSFGFDSFNNWNGYYGFNEDDLYRAYMPEWSYHWGSNQAKALYGVLNQLFVNYEMNPEVAADFELKAAEQLHYFHGVNPMGLVYLSNMYDLGGDRCVNEIYHAWFRDGSDWDHALDSPFGPPPGYMSGGPNADFSLSHLTPPSGQPRQKSYLDFNDDWPNNSWEISEPAIYYQAAYIRLLANYFENTIVDDIETLETQKEVKLFPNPANDQTQIVTEFNSFELKLLNLNGQLIRKKISATNSMVIDLSNIPAGTYFLRITDEFSGIIVSTKLIRQ